MDESDKTSLYGDKKNEKTGLYSESESKFQSGQQGLNDGDKLLLKEKEYKIVRIISKGTGEANVYQIADAEGGLFALKLYFEFKNELEEPNGIALDRIKQLDDPDILKLIDYGIGEEKFQNKYCFEISEFAKGGNILDVDDIKKKYSPAFIKKTIVPEVYKAIVKLHQYKIYHCDIKPGNILYKDKEQTDIILGDYGSAKAYDLKSEKALRKSTTIKGTEYYLAPEQARGIVSEKNDYYSFGMVLLHLLYPESFCTEPDYRAVDKDKFGQIIERQYNLKPIIEFNPKYKDLNTLIEGLTLLNHINRWGSKEVERWMNGEKVDVSYQTKDTESIKPLKTGPIEIHTAVQFVDYIENKNTWFEDFFEDTEVFKLIQEWLDSLIGIPHRKRFEKLVDLYKLSGKAILQSAISLFLIPQKPIYIENTAFGFDKNLQKDISSYLARIDTIYKFATTNQLLQFFFQLEFKLNLLYYQEKSDNTAKTLLLKLYDPIVADFNFEDTYNYKTIIPGHLKPAKGEFNYEYLITLFYAFNSNRVYPDNNEKPITNIEELTLFYIEKDSLFKDKYHTYERAAILKKLKLMKMVNYSYREMISQVLSKYAEVSVKLNYVSFQSVCNIHYSLVHALTNYLKQKNIDKEIIFKEEHGFIYIDKNKALAFMAANSFVKYLRQKHSNISVWSASLNSLKREIRRKHRQYLLLNSFLSVLSTVFIVAIIAAIILRFLNIIGIRFLN